MCKKLVHMEIYDNMRTAFKTLQHLRNETGMSWSMYAKSPDQYGHVLFEIYGTFDCEDVEYATRAIENCETSLGDNN